MKADYIILQGEELSLSLIANDGDISVVESAEAVLKLAGPNGSVPTYSTPAAAHFTVSQVPAPDEGWQFVLTGEETQNLKPGFYVTNAKLNLFEGGPIKTSPISIEIRGSVT